MYKAEILADSISSGVRLVSMAVTFPRIVLAEMNTHRTFCLAGDSELEFDLPAGGHGSSRRVHHMRLDEFVDKWLHGARRYGAKPKRAYDTSHIDAVEVYSTVEAASLMGMSGPSNLNALCRAGLIPSHRHENGRTWMLRGQSLLEWRQSEPEHTRFDIRSRLSGMRIRQLNETTGDIQWANVVDAVQSGTKDVHEVIAGDFTVAGSLDHLVFTTEGWKTIRELKKGDFIIVRKFGKRDDDRLDPLRLRKIDGVWRSAWQEEERARLTSEDPNCRRCCIRRGQEIHHIEPVYQNPSRAFDRSNITLLCERCHKEDHRTQGWQGGTYLYGAAAPVDEVVFRGQEPTYDLSISGDFPNFLANGVVVHNSRSSASSRAIPVEKRIAAVRANPFIPAAFGSNKKGMQAGDVLDRLEQEHASSMWMTACEDACLWAEDLAEIGVHKQWANRLIEPFAWTTAVITATEWANFFALRISPLAQPEMQTTAEAMKAAMDASTPNKLIHGQWHLPYIKWEEVDEIGALGPLALAKISSARCARVSYLTQDGVRDLKADLELHDRLLSAGHMSPFEHAAKVFVREEEGWSSKDFYGNFRAPWEQYRKQLPNEAVFKGEP